MTEPILIVRAEGPATEGGRMPLRDLLLLGTHVQTALERVARVLVGQANSRRPGRKPRQIAQECRLEVVALSQGSFEIALDLPRQGLEAMDLGVEAVETLLQGLDCISAGAQALPSGYDMGVLYSLRDMGRILDRGISELKLESRTQRLRRRFSFSKAVHHRVKERIRGPVRAERTIDGRLLMADFREQAERCRIHPAMGDPVICEFAQQLEDVVYEYLRRHVRVTGETREDPATGRISSIRISDIEPVYVEGEDFETISAETFWEEKSLEELAAEQGIAAVPRFEEACGAGAHLWVDDDDFEAFLSATKGSERGEA